MWDQLDLLFLSLSSYCESPATLAIKDLSNYIVCFNWCCPHRLICYAQYVILKARDARFKLIKKQLILVSTPFHA